MIVDLDSQQRSCEHHAERYRRASLLPHQRLALALRGIWATDAWNPETRSVAIVSRQGLQALVLAPAIILGLGLYMAVLP